MRNLTEANVTDAVLSTLALTKSARLKEIMTSLVKHLHAFIREVGLTEEEWMAGIQFLTATGHMCDDKRQEFILLSDTLGATTLKDLINNRKPEGSTEYTIFGPFYRAGAKELPHLANIAGDTSGEPVLDDQTCLLLDPRRRAGGHDVESGRPSYLPAGTHSLYCLRCGLRVGNH